MVTKPFLAARIPEDLNTKLEEHSASTGEGRTQAVINALGRYLNFTPESKSEESAGDRLSVLERKVAELEKIINEPKQISFLDAAQVISKEVLPKVQTDNKELGKTDSRVIASDNNVDNISPIKPEQSKVATQPIQKRGKFIGRMKTQDVPNLPGLEDEDPKRIKVKLNNIKSQKNQFTQVGRYFVELAKSEDIVISQDITLKPKKQDLLWDVYDTEEI